MCNPRVFSALTGDLSRVRERSPHGSESLGCGCSLLLLLSKVADWQNEAKFRRLFKGVDPRVQLAGVDRVQAAERRRALAGRRRSQQHGISNDRTDWPTNPPPWPPALAKLRRRRLRRR